MQILYGIKACSSLNQPVDSGHPCLTNNGGCQKFCLPVPNSKGTADAKCACPYGEKVTPEGKCVADPLVRKLVCISAKLKFISYLRNRFNNNVWLTKHSSLVPMVVAYLENGYVMESTIVMMDLTKSRMANPVSPPRHVRIKEIFSVTTHNGACHIYTLVTETMIVVSDINFYHK